VSRIGAASVRASFVGPDPRRLELEGLERFRQQRVHEALEAVELVNAQLQD